MTATLSSLLMRVTESGGGMTIDQFQHTFLWTLILGAVLAFVLGFGMGANDVSNAFGTSVGSRVLTMRQAYLLATIFETLGAVLVGYNVTDTMRKGVVDVGVYAHEPKLLLFGQVAILGGCSAWLLIATYASLPVSTTHSVVGATVGFSLACKWTEGVQWWEIGRIVASWVVSPALSGSISALLYLAVDFAVLRRRHPLRAGLRSMPVFFFCCLAFNTFAVSYQGSKILNLASLPAWLAGVLSLVVGLVAALGVHYVMRPRLESWLHRKNTITSLANAIRKSGSVLSHRQVTGDDLQGVFVIQDKALIDTQPPSPARLSVVDLTPAGDKLPSILHRVQSDGGLPRMLALGSDVRAYEEPLQERPRRMRKTTIVTDDDIVVTFVPQEKPESLLKPKALLRWLLPAQERKEDKKTLRLFSSVQVFTACFAGFAHGANDVSNAIAPLTALIAIYSTGGDVQQSEPTPLYVLLFGVLAICVGLCLLGHRVIGTVGNKMSHIHPASGFTIEFGAAVTALLASKLGLPISTTHCLVGSVVSVGCIKAGEGIRWSILRNVVLSWIVTLPISGAIAAVIMLALKWLFI